MRLFVVAESLSLVYVYFQSGRLAFSRKSDPPVPGTIQRVATPDLHSTLSSRLLCRILEGTALDDVLNREPQQEDSSTRDAVS